MEVTKKKSKKSFAVPAATPNSAQVTNENENSKKDLAKNLNNNKVDEVKTMKPHFKKDKTKIEEMTSSKLDTKNEKQKAANKDNDLTKKIQRSLTTEEYDDIFMSVLRSVMKAEQEGDVDDEGIEGEQRSQEKESESDDEETQSQIIEVTVKVEEVAGQEHFENMEIEEDIDNWETAETSSEKAKSHKNCAGENLMSSSKAEKSTAKKTEKTVKSPGKQQKKKKMKKKREAEPEKPLTTDSTVKKNKFVAPNIPNEDKDTKVKKTKLSKSTVKQTEDRTTPKKEKVSLKKVMQERELEDLGTWVQCGNHNCLKWRYLNTITDPMEIPHRWDCSMNNNEKFNSCDKPEEDYDESEHIYTKYTEGSVVLAKMAGYPWWPGMIEIDPDYETYYEVATPASMYPTKYHVVFFDKNVSRAWISISSIKPFDEIEALPRKAKGHDYSKEVNAAVKNAKEAIELSIKERLKKFSFSSRFSGKWGNMGGKSTKKSGKQKECKKRGPKKQKLDDYADNLVDDSTLDRILNNSQSVLSDVAEMLSSIENASIDSDEDPEFDIEAPKSRKRKIPSNKRKTGNECPTLNAVAFENLDSDNEDVHVKFEIPELDKEIFTMEMDMTPVEASDIEKTVNYIYSTNEKYTEELNVQESCEKVSYSDKNINENEKSDAGKQKKQKKTSGEKTGKVEKEKGKLNEDIANQTKARNKLKTKDKKSKENVHDCDKSKKDEKVEDKIESKKMNKKTKKTDTFKSNVATDVAEKGNDTIIQDKSGKSKKKVSTIVKANIDKKEGKDTSGDHKYTVKETKKEVNIEKNKKAKLPSGGKINSEPCETKCTDAETSQNKTTSKNEKKIKKAKSRFSNPIAKLTVKEEDKLSQKEKNSEKFDKDETTVNGKLSSGSQKGKKTKKQTKLKTKESKLDERDTDEELDLIVNSLPANSGAESDDDFMLDLNEKVDSKVHLMGQSATDVDGDNSEPLDFEE